MKISKQRLKCFSLLLLGLLFISACDNDEENDSVNQITIGGDTDLNDNTVGNVIDGIVTFEMDGDDVVGKGNIEITGKSDDIVEFTASFSTDNKNIESTLQQFAKYGKEFTNSFTCGDGNFQVNCKAKNSTEGFAMINSKGEQAVVMKYDVSVGDTWSYRMENGNIEHFKVVKKSTENDYNMGGLHIKVVEIEQMGSTPGVSKIKYIGNHRFGLVAIKVFTEDGNAINFEK